MYVWVADSLWPSGQAVLGVYEYPPPEEGPVSAITIDLDSPAYDDFFNAQAVKTARALTQARDWLHDRLPF